MAKLNSLPPVHSRGGTHPTQQQEAKGVSKRDHRQAQNEIYKLQEANRSLRETIASTKYHTDD